MSTGWGLSWKDGGRSSSKGKETILAEERVDVEDIVGMARSSSNANIDYYRDKPSEGEAFRAFDGQFKEIEDLKDRNFKERKNEDRNFETQLKQIDTSKREMK